MTNAVSPSSLTVLIVAPLSINYAYKAVLILSRRNINAVIPFYSSCQDPRLLLDLFWPII